MLELRKEYKYFILLIFSQIVNRPDAGVDLMQAAIDP